VFILYAIVAGLIVGLVTGGSPARLGDLRFRWAPAIALGLFVQVALFSTPFGGALGPLAPWVYVASNVLVLAAVAANLSIPGMVLVLLGGLSNVVAIAANGGYMPVSAAALDAMGRSESTGYSNSRLAEDVRLAPLTDIFTMPAWLPAANVFSLGDILIALGATILIVAAMHRGAPALASRSGDPDTSSAPGGATAH
jgi:hypothetical protein